MQQSLLREVSEVTAHLDNHDMKQVKGLEDRLFSLEQIIHQAKLTVQEQKDMAQVRGEVMLCYLYFPMFSRYLKR